jgi:CheY-like chemotaxis protein
MSEAIGRPAMTILCAEDDPDDRLLMQDALQEAPLGSRLLFMEDGEELMSYLHRRGPWADPASSPRPSLILLDLNMPRKDGREALREIKESPSLRTIPVVILTTSAAEADVTGSYGIGANSYIIKPVTFDGLVQVMRQLGHYWLETVQLPKGA